MYFFIFHDGLELHWWTRRPAGPLMDLLFVPGSVTASLSGDADLWNIILHGSPKNKGRGSGVFKWATLQLDSFSLTTDMRTAAARYCQMWA
jgi:hypothetical protein